MNFLLDFNNTHSIQILALVIFLGGCASQEEIQRWQQQKLDERMVRLQSICDGYGFSRGTDAYSQCMQRADRDLADAAERQRRDSQESFRRAMCYSTGRLDCP